MNKGRVLVIADVPEISKTASNNLSDAGFEVIHATTGARGAQQAIAEQPDAIIVDLRLRGGSGRLALSFLRKSFRTSHIPVVVLDERGAVRDDPSRIEESLPRVQRRPLAVGALVTGIESGLCQAAG